MAHMLAYPGRTFGQLYHRFFRVNDLADGRVQLDDGHAIDIADVHVPVLVVAGSNDVLAPRDAVHHVESLLTGSPDVRVETAKGGHLGVLTGRGARTSTWHHLDRFLSEYDHRRELEASVERASWLPSRPARVALGR
jgi:polyhydroxyalkanoate synthase